MHTLKIVCGLTLCVVLLSGACASSKKSRPIAGSGSGPEVRSSGAESARPAPFTADDNPTTNGGRGAPTLDDFFAPAAWIYVDGMAGMYLEQDGNPQVQWVIEAPTNSMPTFRAEAFAPLVGDARDFACTVDTVDSADGSTVAYAIKADEGTFRLGQTYSLCQPGSNFTIRNRMTGDVVTEIAPLTPGTYVIAGSVKNLQTGKEALAITYFTVSEEAGS
jgi:hypothetical protein